MWNETRARGEGGGEERRASKGISEKEETVRGERRGEKTLRVYERVGWKIRGSHLTTIQPPPRLVSFSFKRCLQHGYFYRGHHHSEKISSRPRISCGRRLRDGIVTRRRGEGGEGKIDKMRGREKRANVRDIIS